MALEGLLFFLLAGMAMAGGLGVLLFKNPIFSALSLIIVMGALAGHFFLLDAYFVAGAQLIVYAGAVAVLFVMVVMLFDLKKDGPIFSPGLLTSALKLVAAGGVLGFILGAVKLMQEATAGLVKPQLGETPGTEELAFALFSKHVFAFEMISILLLIAAVGAVSVARSKGGTHA